MAKILVVDDSEMSRHNVKQALEGAGHQVYVAEEGQAGINALNENAGIEFIFCDVNMPGMDGLTMCREVKKIDKLKHIPIIMLTTEGSMEMKAKGKEIGILAWVTKPADGEKLLNVVTKVLSMKKAA